MSREEVRSWLVLGIMLMAALAAPHGWRATVFCALVILEPDRKKEPGR